MSEKSKYHLVNVTLINGDILDEVEVHTLHETRHESEVIRALLSRDTFRYGGSWFPIRNILSITYKGIDEWSHNKYVAK